jgi:Restriction endonuclease BglII
MKFETTYHRNADAVILSNQDIKKDYDEIIEVINSISDLDLITEFERRKTERSNIKSLSEPINFLIDERLVAKGWDRQSQIFREEEYSKKGQTAWRLDFAKNTISVEVGFNHGEAISHNLIKPVLASELNHVEKSIQTKMGVIITATDELKKYGGFDSAVGSYEKYKSYLRPFNNILTTPIVLIGLKLTSKFIIEQRTIDRSTKGFIKYL